MSFAHLTFPTRQVEKTASFLEKTLRYRRCPTPANIPIETVWLEIAHGQTLHVFYAEGFEVSPFESEFGRHVALFYPGTGFAALKQRLVREGAELIAPERPTPFDRFFFREPVNGYLFEIVDAASAPK